MTDAHMHIDDDAELYALGALDDLARARVDAAAERCDDCARRVGEAEATVARLVAPADVPSALTRRVTATFIKPRSTGMRAAWGALAAAFVIGLLPSIVLVSRERAAEEQTAAQSAALSSLVHSHFLHAAFTPLAPGAPAAKVIYARDGSWMYVIVDGNHAYDVVGNPGAVSLGTLRGDANSTLYLARPPRVKTIELRDGTRAIARANVIF
jgi:anti-sigma-K factor RskA